VDQFLNIKLDGVTVVEEARWPHLASVRNVFIRGSVVRYVHLPGTAVDTALLEDATRRGEFGIFLFLFFLIYFTLGFWDFSYLGRGARANMV
jgi:hypothetical protein